MTLNYLINCKRRFNVYIMKFYISSLDHAKKLTLGSYFQLLRINKMFEYRHACVILCNVGYFFGHGRYISALEHFRMLI